MTVDILAIAAHRDDVELTCAGTLLRAVDQGHRTGILDLTAGESGTRGSAALRAEEAERAAGDPRRERSDGMQACPTPGLFNTDETRRIVAAHIRHFAPRVVILPFPVGRHPDHRIASELGRDAAFLAGLARFPGRRRPAPAAQAALLARLPRGSAQADVRRGHHGPVRAQDAGDPVLRQPVRWRQGGG